MRIHYERNSITTSTTLSALVAICCEKPLSHLQENCSLRREACWEYVSGRLLRPVSLIAGSGGSEASNVSETCTFAKKRCVDSFKGAVKWWGGHLTYIQLIYNPHANVIEDRH